MLDAGCSTNDSSDFRLPTAARTAASTYNCDVNVSELGEFGLIARLRATLPRADGMRLLLGAGDDAAVWRRGDGYAMATTDTMVAGTHFLPGKVDWRDVGWKALATNISDIAAMGGTPTFALITLCLPPDAAVAAIDELYAGLRECAAAFGVTIAGGDIVSSPVFTITIALTGTAAIDAGGAPLLLRRDAAAAGNIVAVSGALGGSAGGLRLLLAGSAATSEVERLLARRHMRPVPRVDVGHAAIVSGVRCGMDISDGLVQDLGHICEASGLAAELWLGRVPADAALATRFPDEAAMLAATGGEDYELLLVGDEDALARTSAALPAPLVIVGRMLEGEPRVRVLDERGAEIELPARGWDHLSSVRR